VKIATKAAGVGHSWRRLLEQKRTPRHTWLPSLQVSLEQRREVDMTDCDLDAIAGSMRKRALLIAEKSLRMSRLPAFDPEESADSQATQVIMPNIPSGYLWSLRFRSIP
jgi:hypothetical protein